MDLHYLKIFYEVAKEQSFTKAASKLYVNQSAVSIQIKKFEEILETKLFDRSSKKIKLTYAGEALFKMAEDIFNKVQRADIEIKKLIESDGSKIKIGATPVIGEPLLPRMMKDFSVRHPEIDYEIVISKKDSLIKLLREGVLDVLIIDSEHIMDVNLECLQIQSTPYILVGKKDFLQVENITEQSLISRSDILNNNLVIKKLEKKYTSSFQKKIEVRGSIELIKTMVKEGIGIAILPYYTVKKEIKNGEIKEIERIEEINDGYQVVITKDKRNIMSIIKFIKFSQLYNM